MVTLVGLQSDVLVALHVALLELLDLALEDLLGGDGRVNAVGLNRDDEVAAVLQEVLRIQRDDTRLVRLRDVSEDLQETSHKGGGP